MIRGLALGLLLLCGLGRGGKEKPAPATKPSARVPTAVAPAPSCEGDSILRVTVQTGDYLHAVADQDHRDVTLILLDPGGQQLLEVDGLNAAKSPPWPAEEIHWVADAAGELRIELRIDQTFPPGFHGPCGLRLAEHRRATAADRQRTLAESDLAHAHALRRTHEPKACRAGIAFYESAQHRFAGLGLPRRQAEALLGLGQLQREDLHDDEAALQTYTRAVPLFAGDPALEATVRQNLGYLRDTLGDLDGAIGEYRRALELRRQLGNRFDEALISSNLGRALYLQGRYDEAAGYLDSALDLWQQGDDPGKRGKTLLNRGYLHRDLGEANQARERFGAALALYRQAKDHNGEAAALHALGLLALDAGRYGEALTSLKVALALRPAGSRGRAVTLMSLGVAHRELGQIAAAREDYAEALPIFHSLGDVREQASSLGNLGRLETAVGHDAAAMDHFDRALELYRTLADPPDLAWTLAGKAWVLRRRGDLAAARRTMEKALAAIERHRFSQTSYATRADFFSTQQDRYDFLIDLLMEQRQYAAALEVNERSLARSLLDGLAASGTDLHRAGAAPELQAREQEIEKAIDGLVARQTRLAQEAASREQLRPVEAELARRWSDLDRVRTELRTGDPHYAALTQPQPWKAAEIQRELLDRDTLLLEYRLGEKRSFLWAVTPGSLKSFELPGRAEIEDLTRRIYGLFAGGQSTAELSAVPRLARLSRLLLAPVAPLLPGKRLLVVGDGALQLLPFSALPEPGNGEPLVARHEIVHLPSVSVLGVLRREAARRPLASKLLWVLANPDFGNRFKPLPYTGDEATAILALAPANQCFTIQNRQANRTAVLNGDLRSYRFLHFATHGSFTADDPGGGRLVLAQVDPQGRPVENGFLYLADIYELSLRADLVTLSACQSALGREIRGEGMMGMTRGFFYAGAERVLVSLWNVPDRVTVELMQRFYRGILVEGLSPAAALREAQDWIRRQKGWQSPYHWAGFTLQGEWRGEKTPHHPGPLLPSHSPDREKREKSSNLPATFPSPGRREGDGRGDRGEGLGWGSAGMRPQAR